MIWLVENWFIFVGIVVVTAFIGYVAGRFLKLPRAEQSTAVKEWLLYACLEAEKVLGSGTGKAKLRYVYDMFLTKFPWVAQVISFDTFSLWVDTALIEMNGLLSTNKAVRQMVEGDAA